MPLKKVENTDEVELPEKKVTDDLKGKSIINNLTRPF
jgi:hypothetical protein